MARRGRSTWVHQQAVKLRPTPQGPLPAVAAVWLRAGVASIAGPRRARNLLLPASPGGRAFTAKLRPKRPDSKLQLRGGSLPCRRNHRGSAPSAPSGLRSGRSLDAASSGCHGWRDVSCGGFRLGPRCGGGDSRSPSYALFQLEIYALIRSRSCRGRPVSSLSVGMAVDATC